MKKTFYRSLAAAMALALVLLLPACTAPEPKSGAPEPKSGAPAIGRYVETELAMPDGVYMSYAIRGCADGTLQMLAMTESITVEGRAFAPLHDYRSADGGATWTEESAPWLDALNSPQAAYFLVAAAWDAQDELLLLLQPLQENPMEYLARVKDGELLVSDTVMPPSDDGLPIRSTLGFRIAGNGDLLVDRISCLQQVDPESGKLKNVYTAPDSFGSTMIDGWAVSGTTLVLTEKDRLVWYDLKSGKETRSLSEGLPAQGPYFGYLYRVMDFSPDGYLLFADPKGVYHVPDGNDTLERLVDGALTSLSSSDLLRTGFIALEDRYILLGKTSEATRLLSYSYDPDISTVPSQPLSVWSLYEDPLIRQAITVLQKSNPDAHVTYQVGYSADNAITAEDALRTLTTQITAGKCPDVLVLDGLPIDSYVENGVLADLSPRLKALTDSGTLLANIANTYRQEDGTVPAVPTRFQVPMLHGSDEAMDAIHDLASLADWLESRRGDYLSPFIAANAASILTALYPVCADGLKDPGGGTDEAKLREFLFQTKRILDLRTDADLASRSYDYPPEFSVSPVGWSAGYNALDIGNLVEFPGLYAAWTAGGRTDTLFGGSGYLPVTTLGISAASAQQDLAWAFLEAAFSPQVQDLYVFGKGMPASAAVFDASTAVQDGKEVYQIFSSRLTDAEGGENFVELEVLYPTGEYRAQWADRIKALDHPLLYDPNVFRLILDGSADYFSGKTDLDSAVNGIAQKLSLYEAE